MRERAMGTNDGGVAGKRQLFDPVLWWIVEAKAHPVEVVDEGSVKPYRQNYTAQLARLEVVQSISDVVGFHGGPVEA